MPCTYRSVYCTSLVHTTARFESQKVDRERSLPEIVAYNHELIARYAFYISFYTKRRPLKRTLFSAVSCPFLSLSLSYPLCQSTNTIAQVQAWRFRDIVTSAYSYTGLFEVLWKPKRRQIPKSNEDSHWYITAYSCNVFHDLPSSNIAELCLSIRPWTCNDEKQLIYV